MKTIILILLLIVSIKITHAQDPDWIWAEQSSSGTSTDLFTGTAVDANGNVYAIGIISGAPVTFGCTTISSSSALDLVLVKYDQTGTVQWVRNTPIGAGTYLAFAVRIDPAGNPVIIGNSNAASVTFGSTTLNTAGLSDFFVVKYDPSGSVIWAKRYGGTGDDYFGGGRHSVDGSGNIFIAGDFKSSSITFGATTLTNGGGSDGFIAKLDGNGNAIWAKKIGSGSDDDAYSAIHDAAGNVFVSGEILSGSENAFLNKYDASGNLLWTRNITGSGLERAYAVAVDNSGNSYTAGWMGSATTTIGSFTLTNHSAGSADIFVAKYDAAGNVMWAVNYGGTAIESIDDNLVVDNTGNLRLAISSTSSSVTYGSFTLLNANPGVNDIHLLKLDATTGNALAANSYGGSLYDVVNSMDIDANNQLYLAGGFTSAPFQLSTLSLSSNGSTDAWIGKYGTPLSISCSAPATLCLGSTFELSYTATGTFNGGNIFTAQLSDNSGNFCAAVDIGSITSSSSGSISCTVPGLPLGTGYRVRIVSSDPSFIGSDNGTAITLGAVPTVSISSNSPVCEGETLNFTASGGPPYAWSGPGGFSSSQQNPSITNAQLANAGTYSLTVGSSGCEASATTDVAVTEASTYYADTDDDGYGDPASSAESCEVLSGYVADNTDCDDSNPSIHPDSPELIWQKSLGGSSEDVAISMVQATDGGYVVAGYSWSNDGDVSVNHGWGDYLIIKLDASSNVVWTKTLGGSALDQANSIQQTADGGYIVAGSSASNDFDVSGNNGGIDYWIVKLDASGNVVWQNNFGGSNDDEAHNIQQTADGGYIVAGSSFSNDGDVSGNHGFSDYWIIKLDAAGSMSWQKSLGGSAFEIASSVKQISDGFIVAGYTGSNDGNVSGNHGSDDIWVVKLDASGNLTWQKCFGGTGIEFAHSVGQTTDGFIVAGYSTSNDGDVTGNHGLHDYWVLKLNPSGDIQWQKSLGGSNYDFGQSVTQTADGGYAVAGYSLSTDGDVTGNHGAEDYWIVKLTTSGEIDWEKSFGGSDVENAFDVVESSDGAIVVCGSSASNDGDVTGNHPDAYSNTFDFWVVKISESGSIEVCNTLDDDCDGEIDEGISCDGDGDGYTVADGDCNDANAAIHPGATEICNGFDDDCNGTVDFTFSITASAGLNGTIIPAGITSVNCGSNQLYTITPDANYSIANVFVDNVSVGAVSSYTFTNAQDNHTIAATFISSTHVICSITDCSTSAPNTFEFDLYVLNDGTNALKLNSIAYGINVNAAILSNAADVLTWSYIGGSDLPAAITNTFSFSYASGIKQLKLTSSAFAMNYSTAPNLPIGTPVKVGHFRVTNNSHNWAAASTTNLSLNTTTGGFNTNTGINAYIGTNTVVTAINNATIRSVVVDCSLTLNCTPSITCPSNISVNSDAGACRAVVSYAFPASTGCPGTQITQIEGIASGATFPVGVTTNTFKATDPSGNFSTCSFTVTVTDIEAPVTPTIAAATGECSVTVTAPTTTDNCAGTVTGTTNDPLTYNSQGTYTIHWSFNDGNGNSTTADQTVIVQDVTAPVVPTLATATGECSVTVTAPATTDNCAGTVTGTTADPLSYNVQGSYTIHWSFDDGHGNISTSNQSVVVDDITAPVPDVLDLPVVTGECSASVMAPTSTDNCVGAVTGTTTDAISYSSQGTFVVHWQYDDGNGNVYMQNQTVVIDDITPPSITCPSAVTVSANATGCSASGVSLGIPTGSDNCGTVSFSNDAPLLFPLGATSVTWTADDSHGNTLTCTQSVTVINPASVSITETDNSGPVADDGILCASGGSATLTASGAATYTWAPSAGLNQTTGASVIATPAITTTYTVTGTTGIGCVATSTFIVTVQICTSDVSLKFFIEGYYDTLGLMKPVLYNHNVESNASSTNVDTVVIQLHPATSPSVTAYSFKGLLQTNGTLACTFPDAVVGGSYYIVIKHRSALQTWSANPVTLGYTSSYNFSTASNLAYWNNMTLLEPGVWGIYNGDINQDESIDIYDVPPFDYDIQYFLHGYLNTDINGDGAVDIFDSPILNRNSQNFVGSIHP